MEVSEATNIDPSRQGAAELGTEETMMATLACSQVPSPSWSMLRVQLGDPSLPTTLTGPARLIALYQWRRGKRLPGLWFVDSASMRVSRTPDGVDWALFPVAEARNHLMDHEERCLRHLVRRSYH